ncbi:hypothetical protein EON66_05375, partial [archaeon]
MPAWYTTVSGHTSMRMDASPGVPALAVDVADARRATPAQVHAVAPTAAPIPPALPVPKRDAAQTSAFGVSTRDVHGQNLPTTGMLIPPPFESACERTCAREADVHAAGSASNAQSSLRAGRSDWSNAGMTNNNGVDAVQAQRSVSALPGSSRAHGSDVSLAGTGDDPASFVSGYMANSRLHFIGSFKAHAQQLVARERQLAPRAVAGAFARQPEGASTHTYSGDDTAAGQHAAVGALSHALLRADAASHVGSPRIIVHIDMDCFFAQVALLDYPHLVEHPVVVAHSRQAPPPPIAPPGTRMDAAMSPAAGSTPAQQQPSTSRDCSLEGESTSSTEHVAATSSVPPAPRASHMGARRAHGALLTSDSGSSDNLLPTSMTVQGPTASSVQAPAVVNPYGGGEVSSANYPARKFGIHAGMGVNSARKLCPQLIVLPYNFERIQSISETMFRYDACCTYSRACACARERARVCPCLCEPHLRMWPHGSPHTALCWHCPCCSSMLAKCSMFLQLTPNVQAVSCDEAYLDLSGASNASELIRDLRRRIFEETHCTVSAGVASNMLLARLATAKAKPNGMFVLADDPVQVQQFMCDLPVCCARSFSRACACVPSCVLVLIACNACSLFFCGTQVACLPGVGHFTKKKLHEKGLLLVRDLLRVPKLELRSAVGDKTAESLLQYAQGKDDRSVQTQTVRKSVGLDVNWGVRLQNAEQSRALLRTMCVELASRLGTAADELLALVPTALAAAAPKE